MEIPDAEDKVRVRKEKAKKAIALAMQNRWEDAVSLNRSILKDFSDDLEAYNRLGKALSELGRNRDATEAFQSALQISPTNSIARKNLERLSRLGDEAPRSSVNNTAPPQVFIEESGKTGVTSLLKLALPIVLLRLAPGHAVRLKLEGTKLMVTDSSSEHVGQVEPKLASRLKKLMTGGNRYEAVTTSVGERELTIIIREVYKHPSQMGIVSFPLRSAADYRVYLPSTVMGYDVSEEEAEDKERVAVKDWSNDDTEPGDDEAFSPVLHRVINPEDRASAEDEDNF